LYLSSSRGLPGRVDTQRAVIRAGERADINQSNAQRVSPSTSGVRAVRRITKNFATSVDASGEADVCADDAESSDAIFQLRVTV
jgi:hypothetical protein